MTVHKAKGLEFPVVILADLTCRISRNDASRYLDSSRRLCALRIGGWSPHELHEHEAEEVERDRAEGVRLAYVAATRARDLLVVPALGDAPWEGGWCEPLNGALYPALPTRRAARRGPSCPAFKSKDSVLQRPNDEPAGSSTVCPGQHSFEEGYSVVWWDPGALALGVRPPFGVRREELIVKDVPRDVVADGRGRYDRWKLGRLDARARGSQPSLLVRTVSESVSALEGASATSVPAIEVIALPRDADERPHGPGFGTLVHAMLAQVPFDAGAGLIGDLAAIEARLLGLGADAATAATALVGRVLAHDLLARARAASSRGACRRETPITASLPDGTLLEGTVDLAFEEDGRWTVVDYKTDREIAATGEQSYRRQVAVYIDAIAQATGARCAGVVLVI